MIDPEVFDEAVDKAVRSRCKAFDTFILALFSFGVGVFVTGMALYYFN